MLVAAPYRLAGPMNTPIRIATAARVRGKASYRRLCKACAERSALPCPCPGLAGGYRIAQAAGKVSRRSPRCRALSLLQQKSNLPIIKKTEWAPPE